MQAEVRFQALRPGLYEVRILIKTVVSKSNASTSEKIGHTAGLAYLSLVLRKPVFRVSDQVPHKPGCTGTEDGWRLAISYLERRWIVLSL